MEGSDIVNYGDTICVVGGFDESTKMARKSVSCWNPLQVGADDDAGQAGNGTSTKGVIGKLRPLGMPNPIVDDSKSDSNKFGRRFSNNSDFKVKIGL